MIWKMPEIKFKKPVRSIISLTLTGVVAYLAITGQIKPESVLAVFSMVVGYYFKQMENETDDKK